MNKILQKSKTTSRFVLVVFALIMSLSTVFAQSVKVTGTVTDINNEPIIGATVTVVGTTNATMTDVNGQYTLNNVASSGTLKFKFLGYTEKDVAVNGQTTINAVLEEQTIGIEEIVVVGFGSQKKANLTGAVASVSGDVMTKRPVTNPATMLQGMAAGVSVTQNLGQPGEEGVSIRVRGQGTFSDAGSDPLVLINGVPGSMTNLDPSMIENVSVLKDAASASIYGARAANGVILVTTKQGSKGGKSTISYSGNFAWHSPTKMFDIVTNSVEYMELYNQAKANSGRPDVYTQAQIDMYRNNVGNDQYPNFDWQDYMFNTAFAQTHNLSASGSTEKVTYNVALNYVDQNGTLRGFKYNKYNATVDVTAKVNDFITIGSYSNLMMGDRSKTRQSQDDALLSTLSQAPTYMPWLPDAGDGMRRYTNAAFESESHNKNMPAIIDVNALNKYRNYDINSQLWLDIKLAKGLKWYSKAAVRLQEDRTTDWRGAPTPLYMYHKDSQGNYIQKDFLDKGGIGFDDSKSSRFYTNLYTYLQYDVATSNNAHQFRVMVGYSQENEDYNKLGAYRRDYPFELPVIDAGGKTGWSNSGGAEAWALQSVFGRFNYNFKERYLFEANVRYDGSSRIAPDSRWGIFPSFSAAWRLSEESFMQDTKSWLSNAKIRASWGQLGNQNIGLYPYQAMIAGTTSYPFDKANESLGYIQNAYANNLIKWETTTSMNIGLDAGFLDNRLNFTAEWFQKTTSDILRSMQVTNLLGLTAPTINNGEMKNSGFEFSLNWKDVVRNVAGSDFQYNVGVNFTTIKNSLSSFGSREINGYYLREEGLAWESYYMLDCIGVFATDDEVKNAPKQFNDNTQAGDLRYRDANNDGKINDDDRIIIDGKFPSLEYSVVAGINWKGIDLNIIGSGVVGRKFFTNGWGVNPFRQGSAPTREYLAGMWTPENPNGASNPRLYDDDLGGSKNSRSSTWFLDDASYFRLKNVTLGYTLPRKWTEKVKMNRVRVYFSGDNLVTFTKFKGLDPERGGDGRAAQYPQNQILSFGINVEF